LRLEKKRVAKGVRTVKITRRQLVAGSSSALGMPFVSGLARAQATPVILKVHHFLGTQSNAHKFWIDPWAKRVEAASAGKMKVEVYPSMQLGGRPPQLYDQAKDGVVDIVWTLAGNTPGRFPRFEVFELPWVPSVKGEVTSQAAWDFYEAQAKDEVKDVKMLAVFAHAKGNIYTKDKDIKRPEDIKGLKVRVPNRTINDTLVLLGASPQGIPAPGVPEALAKGVVDGVMFPYEVVPALKVDELTNRASTFAGDRALYTVIFFFAMNKAKYDGLPADLKKIIDDNSGASLSREIGKGFDDWDKSGIDALAKRGTNVTSIDGADLAAWKAATAPVVANWVEARTKAGDKGAELLKAAEDLIAKYTK
jgi:TRAP-type transport system periplasmic protein